MKNIFYYNVRSNANILTCILPREKYCDEYEIVVLYNWIGDKEIDIEKIDELKIIFIREGTVYDPSEVT